MYDRKDVANFSVAGEGTANRNNIQVIAVGDLDLWRETYGRLPIHRDVHFSDLDNLISSDLELMHPELIVSPIVTPRFDCLDVAFSLYRCGYDGIYRALSRGLPNPAMIRREVRGFCPGLDFDVTEILDDTPLFSRCLNEAEMKPMS